MGSIGAVLGREPDVEAQLRRALGRAWHRGTEIETTSIGPVAIGCAGSSVRLHAGATWSVAFSGVADSIGGDRRPDDPALKLAVLLETEGPSALGQVRGDFTAVASDGRRILACRDHLGTDGLFLGMGAVAAVMSEPKQVVEAQNRSRRADVDRLVSVYFNQWEAADDVPSVVEGTERVPRGSIVEVDDRGWRRIGRVWEPSALFGTARLSVDEAVEEGWNVVREAVTGMITSRTAVGLSGGIDSTLIAAAAAGHDVGAVSAVYPDAPSVDESEYISATAERFGMALQTYVPRTDRLDAVDKWVNLVDGPSHGLALGPVSEMNDVAAGAGYSTLLGGELAELVYDLREHALAKILQRGRLGPLAAHLRGLRAKGMSTASLGRILVGGLIPSPIGLAFVRRYRQVGEPASWLDPSFMPGLNRRWDLERPASRRWADIQLFFATGPSFPGLEVATIMGDMAGVRTRRPLADRNVWEFFLSLPPEVKFPDAQTKSLVRMMLDGRAPSQVVWRTDKTVFDEDSLGRAEYQYLHRRLSDGFRLPGVDYPELLRRLEGASMTMWELSMARTLVSIHAFVAVAP